MLFNKTTLRILVRGDYGACYDFYTKKLGFIPVYGDRSGPYTSFTPKEGEPACFAIFNTEHMAAMVNGYTPPAANAAADTIIAVIPSEDLDNDYQRLKAAGVEFLAPPQYIEAWGMRFACFRDTEGNLFEINDAEGV